MHRVCPERVSVARGGKHQEGIEGGRPVRFSYWWIFCTTKCTEFVLRGLRLYWRESISYGVGLVPGERRGWRATGRPKLLPSPSHPAQIRGMSDQSKGFDINQRGLKYAHAVCTACQDVCTHCAHPVHTLSPHHTTHAPPPPSSSPPPPP
eukprot:709322-Rhodomonas_salina.1